jgi:hypothetical protein
MFFFFISWSVLHHQKGVYGGTENQSKIDLQNGISYEVRGWMMMGSFCANETRFHTFIVDSQQDTAFFQFGIMEAIFLGSIVPIPEFIIANKCYPWFLYSVSTHSWSGRTDPPLQLRFCPENENQNDCWPLNIHNSLSSPYDGCTDGWTGENCDVSEIRSQISHSCSVSRTNITPELIALFFFE